MKKLTSVKRKSVSFKITEFEYKTLFKCAPRGMTVNESVKMHILFALRNPAELLRTMDIIKKHYTK